ncbi:unnamed protein product [Rhizopus stolonifer]
MLSLPEEYLLVWLRSVSLGLITLISHMIYILFSISRYAQVSKERLSNACLEISNIQNLLLDTIHTTQENLFKTLSIILTVLKTGIVFFLNMYKSTFRCFLVLAIHSLLSVLTDIAAPLQDAAQILGSFFSGSNKPTANWTEELKKVQAQMDHWMEDDWEGHLISKPFDDIQHQLNQSLSVWKPSIQPDFRCDMSEIDLLQEKANHRIYILLGALVSIWIIFIIYSLYSIRKNRADLSEKRPYRNNLLIFMSHPGVVYCLVVGLLGVILLNLLESFRFIWVQDVQELKAWVSQTEKDLNEHAVGLIRQVALGLNHTLGSVTYNVQSSLGSILNDNIFQQPLEGLFQCLVGNKIENIEHGLTWIASRAYIQLPTPSFSQKVQIEIPVKDMLWFYYILLICWVLSLCIGLGFQIKCSL